MLTLLSVAAAGLIGLAPPASAAHPSDAVSESQSANREVTGVSTDAKAGTWSTATIAGMNVRLYVPTSEPAAGTGRALMVNLHGCAQNSADLQEHGNWAASAEAHGMIVALPDAPDGGVIMGCWDYYDSGHSRTSPSRHDDNLLDLVAELKGDADLAIDANQVYISGLSSGAGQAMVMGCLAPDVFAGIGISAGPTVGTTSLQIGWVAVSQAQGAATCTSFAGDAEASFGTQLTSVVYGSADYTVAQGYGRLNGAIMAELYGAGTQAEFSLSELAGQNTNGTGVQYSDDSGPRVSVISNTGLGHAWPAGTGAGGAYISSNSIDYPAYLTSFFFENNRRIEREDAPPGGDPSPSPDPDPQPDPDPVGECVTASNAEHQAAGRAVSYGADPHNPYYAIGTRAYMGQGDATVTSLERQSPESYALVSDCAD